MCERDEAEGIDESVLVYPEVALRSHFSMPSNAIQLFDSERNALFHHEYFRWYRADDQMPMPKFEQIRTVIREREVIA